MFINSQRETIMKIEVVLALSSSEFSCRLVRSVDFPDLQNPVSLFWSHDSAHIRMKQRVRTGHPLPWGVPNTNVDTQEAEQHMHLECCHGTGPTTFML